MRSGSLLFRGARRPALPHARALPPARPPPGLTHQPPPRRAVSSQDAKTSASTSAKMLESLVSQEMQVRQMWRVEMGSIPGLKAEIAKLHATERAKRAATSYETEAANKRGGRRASSFASSFSGISGDHGVLLMAGDGANGRGRMSVTGGEGQSVSFSKAVDMAKTPSPQYGRQSTGDRGSTSNTRALQFQEVQRGGEATPATSGGVLSWLGSQLGMKGQQQPQQQQQDGGQRPEHRNSYHV